MNQTVQIAQKFIEVMDQIIPPRTADSSPASTHQQQQYTQTGTVDTVEIRLALICYIQILRSYKNLVHMLVSSVGTTERQQRLDLSDVVPVQIGTLHTVVSPRLQIALLVQLISQHTDEIRHKIRQLASRINETRPNMDPSHPGAFNSNIIGKDIRGEEEDLRDGLDLISERLKMHTQFQDHRGLDR